MFSSCVIIHVLASVLHISPCFACDNETCAGLLSLADSRVHVHSPPPARTNPATTEAIEYQLDQAPSLRHALEDVADALGSVYSSVPDRDTSSPRFRSQGYGNADEDRDDVADDTALQRDPSAGAGDSDMLPAGDSFTAQSDDTLTDSDVPSCTVLLPLLCLCAWYCS